MLENCKLFKLLYNCNTVVGRLSVIEASWQDRIEIFERMNESIVRRTIDFKTRETILECLGFSTIVCNITVI